VNECLLSPCQNNGNCTNRNGSYICDCPIGFTGEFFHFIQFAVSPDFPPPHLPPPPQLLQKMSIFLFA
jgi:hypothetical protein